MLYPEKSMVNIMESPITQSMVSNNPNNVYQPLSPQNRDDISDSYTDRDSPDEEAHHMGHKGQDVSDNTNIQSDLHVNKKYPFSFPPLPNMPTFPSLEDLHKQKQMMDNNIILPASSPQGLLKASPNLFPANHGFSSLTPPSPAPPSSQSYSPSDFGNQQNWSFEEQFKQLYEIDTNPKRKEFLDDLFAFMQKRGTPINRLPIMAKQVLDLYELYNLVVARGGLVEVINKKQWQEIIKGLGLPSSITSAAFTLRTQYTKYLYPLECKLNKLSNPSDLHSAIEGNKREGRTSTYGPYGGMGPISFQNSPLPPSLGGMSPFPMMNTGLRPSMALNGTRLPMPQGLQSSPPPPPGSQDQLAAFEMTRLALLKMYNQSRGMSGDQPRPPISLANLPLPPDMPGFYQENIMDERKRALGELLRKEEEEKIIKMEIDRKNMEEHERNHQRELELKRERLCEDMEDEEEEDVSPPLSKRSHHSDHIEDDSEVTVMNETTERRQEVIHPGTLPCTNIKITTRGEGQESCLVVSMELNGLNYQGILFQKTTS